MLKVVMVVMTMMVVITMMGVMMMMVRVTKLQWVKKNFIPRLYCPTNHHTK